VTGTGERSARVAREKHAVRRQPLRAARKRLAARCRGEDMAELRALTSCSVQRQSARSIMAEAILNKLGQGNS